MLRFDANITMLYRERPLVERFAAARDDGFSAVEILSPENSSIDELQTAATGAGVDVVLCNAPMGDFLEGGPGMSGVPGREAQFRSAIEQARKMAVSLKCPNVHIGPSRIPATAGKDDCLNVLARNLEMAAGVLARDGITATIEPMNNVDFPDVCLSSVADALSVLDAAGRDSVALQFDIYHMARMENDLLDTIKKNIGRIAHFQFADLPGRHEPGSGELDFPAIFGLIDSLNYEGHLGAEYLPSGASSDSLGWFRRHQS